MAATPESILEAHGAVFGNRFEGRYTVEGPSSADKEQDEVKTVERPVVVKTLDESTMWRSAVFLAAVWTERNWKQIVRHALSYFFLFFL